jgi:hypothetical protein
MNTASTDTSRVTPSAVLVLQSMTSYPSVSLLLPTRPGRLDREQAARLTSLRESAEHRLREEEASGEGRSFTADRVLVELDELIARAADVHLDRALALYASEHHAQLLVLPVDVRGRVVVDPTFATRDLVRALHGTPRHVVLIVSEREARLFEGHLGSLGAADTSKFPMTTHDASTGQEEMPAAFLERVDQALGAHLRLRPAPVVVVGAEPTLNRFCKGSANLARLAGTIPGDHLATPLTRLAELVAPHLETYLASRQDEALTLLERRRGQDRAILGIDSVWLAARWERPEMLAVEDDFFLPARLSADGDLLQPASDVEHPDVIDDVVDELVEQVLARGAWVALVDPGRIPDGQRIAMTVRRHEGIRQQEVSPHDPPKRPLSP